MDVREELSALRDWLREDDTRLQDVHHGADHVPAPPVAPQAFNQHSNWINAPNTPTAPGQWSNWQNWVNSP